MMNLSHWGFAALALLLVEASSPKAAVAQQTCPGENAESRSRMEYFLRDEQLAEDRAAIGVPTNDEIRALTSSGADAWICGYLLGEIRSAEYRTAPWLYTFYESGGFYFIVLVKGPVSQTRLRVESGALQGEVYVAPFHVFNPQLVAVLDLML
jgi:hypothetical protein